MSEYMAIWPIDDKTVSTQRLVLEAIPLLYELLEQAGLVADGHIAWSREYTQMTATVRVTPIEATGGDQRPWMSAEMLREELVGGRYVIDELMCERFGSAA